MIIEQNRTSPRYQIPIVLEINIECEFNCRKSLSDFQAEIQNIRYANTGEYVGSLVFKYLCNVFENNLNLNTNDVEAYLD